MTKRFFRLVKKVTEGNHGIPLENLKYILLVMADATVPYLYIAGCQHLSQCLRLISRSDQQHVSLISRPVGSSACQVSVLFWLSWFVPLYTHVLRNQSSPTAVTAQRGCWTDMNTTPGCWLPRRNKTSFHISRPRCLSGPEVALPMPGMSHSPNLMTSASPSVSLSPSCLFKTNSRNQFKMGSPFIFLLCPSLLPFNPLLLHTQPQTRSVSSAQSLNKNICTLPNVFGWMRVYAGNGRRQYVGSNI